MGFFDDIGGLINEIKGPIQDISDTVQQVKDDAVSSFGQLGDDVSSLKDQGQSVVDGFTDTIRGDSSNDSSE